ncbi:hypothetical protein SAMN05421664_3445 [Chryseobacterium soldanellicola]|uniref:Outer membrane protein beta-barrel domain-containing protein n=1 Tax=Chryseobacterium soldanellicola TaxID=311333 RepID=A0A1H1G5Q2_9FLAO|nr:hypothetical protein [Chryseobacterium soldanellicola]SDR08146.1 hypothetical protein SAMN05421664_3445 [Chryseobacterium soldanellicola]
MKTKIALMTAVMAFSYTFAQENPHMKLYSQKIDSIVVSEKSKMDTELNEIDKNFKENKISAEEKQKQRSEIASKYEQIINEKVDEQKSELEDATKSMVKNAVLGKKDTLHGGKNELALEFGGMKMKLNKDKNTPKDYLRTIELSVSLTGANLTSKEQPFTFFNKDSDVRNTVINSSSFTIRYENQVGGFTSPVFYRIGLGVRTDKYIPKYGKVFAQENNTLFVEDFDRGNLRKTNMKTNYIFLPVDLKFVLNPKYIDYEGVKYLDNKKSQLSIVAGIYGGVRLESVMYNKYSNENSKRIVERERVMQGVNNFVFGGKFGIGYGGFNIFIQKDFTPLFNDDAKLSKKYGLQIGIEIANVNF